MLGELCSAVDQYPHYKQHTPRAEQAECASHFVVLLTHTVVDNAVPWCTDCTGCCALIYTVLYWLKASLYNMCSICTFERQSTVRVSGECTKPPSWPARCSAFTMVLLNPQERGNQASTIVLSLMKLKSQTTLLYTFFAWHLNYFRHPKSSGKRARRLRESC